MLTTVNMIMIPGGIHNHCIVLNTFVFLARSTMLPQVGVGGVTPRPRNDSPASVRIALAIPSVALTIMKASVFGRRCLAILDLSDIPSTSVACMNSCSLSDQAN